MKAAATRGMATSDVILVEPDLRCLTRLPARFGGVETGGEFCGLFMRAGRRVGRDMGMPELRKTDTILRKEST